jgi:hypothetical protein
VGRLKEPGCIPLQEEDRREINIAQGLSSEQRGDFKGKLLLSTRFGLASISVKDPLLVNEQGDEI